MVAVAAPRARTAEAGATLDPPAALAELAVRQEVVAQPGGRLDQPAEPPAGPPAALLELPVQQEVAAQAGRLPGQPALVVRAPAAVRRDRAAGHRSQEAAEPLPAEWAAAPQRAGKVPP